MTRPQIVISQASKRTVWAAILFGLVTTIISREHILRGTRNPRSVLSINRVTFGQSWRYKPGLYIARASGCGLPALPHAGNANGPSFTPLIRLILSGLPRAASAARAPEELATLRSRQDSGQPTEQRPGCQQMTPPPADLHRDKPTAQRRAQAPHRHLARTKRAHAPRQARSSRWSAGERVWPGVTAALPLTLAAASLLAGRAQARGMRAGMLRSGPGRARRI